MVNSLTAFHCHYDKKIIRIDQHVKVIALFQIKMDDYKEAKKSRQSKLLRHIICEVQKLSDCSFYQDATLLCSDGSLMLSKFLLASIFPMMREILKTQGQEEVVMSLPDASTDEFKTFFDDLLEEKSKIIFGDTIKSLFYNAKAVRKESKQDIGNQPTLEPKKEDEIIENSAKFNEKIELDLGETDEDVNFDELDPLCDDIKAEIDLSEEEKDSFKEKKPRRKTNLPTYECLVQNCDFEATGLDLRQHLKSEHPNQPLVCNHCGKDFLEFSKLLSHIRGVHMNRRVQRRFTCNFCGKNDFPRELHLKRHIEAVHNDNPERIECDRCKKKLKIASFKYHKCFRDEVCNICGKSVNSLKEHIKNIHNFTIVQCPVCGISLKESSLRLHMKTHNEKSTCPTCGVTVKNLDNHMKIVHTEDEKKNFQCTDCGKGFISNCALQKHRINAHLKTYPYHCRYGCDMKYNDISNRNSHEKKKHGGLYQDKS